VAQSLGIELRLGEPVSEADVEKLSDAFAGYLFELITRQPLSAMANELMLTPLLTSTEPIDVVTFSGGVSEFIYEREERDFGDLSRPLSAAVRARVAHHDLTAPVQPSGERIRATVIGASQFTVQVSGNTISITNKDILPIHNIQVIHPRIPEVEEVDPDVLAEAIQKGFQRFDLTDGEQPIALALNWAGTPRYQLLRNIAEGIVRGIPKTVEAGLPVLLVFVHDFGKLVGDILREEFNISNDVISIDSIFLQEFDYIDIGEVIYPANVVPVVVKSLVFPKVENPTAEVAAVA
jgi:ethanolamine utilization protein EutA